VNEKYIVEYLFNWIVLIIEDRSDTCNTRDKSQNHCAEKKKPDTKNIHCMGLIP
jgi:hypothetical protein